MKDRGYWTRQSIERDNARFERSLGAKHKLDGADPFPPGVPPEQCGELIASNWASYEPNTYGGA